MPQCAAVACNTTADSLHSSDRRQADTAIVAACLLCSRKFGGGGCTFRIHYEAVHGAGRHLPVNHGVERLHERPQTIMRIRGTTASRDGPQISACTPDSKLQSPLRLPQCSALLWT